MLLGKKIGMTQVYDDKGAIVPVTVIQAGPCKVTQVKTEKPDGYNAIQVGFDDVKPSRQKAPALGHAAKAGTTPKRYVREIRLNKEGDHKLGDELTVAMFSEIKYVDVTGTSKGKGFAGVVKRHGFKGMPASHGCERKHRHPGGIGSNTAGRGTGQCVRKGKRMCGHLGDAVCTTRNHLVMGVDVANNLLIVKGAVAGGSNGYVTVKQSKSKSKK